MRKTAGLVGAVVCAAVLGGCMWQGMNKSLRSPGAFAVMGADKSDPAAVRADRMVIWNASLTLEVGNVKDAAAKAAQIAEQAGGFVESKSDTKEEEATLRLRIPAKGFKESLGSLEELGTVKYRQVGGRDVTEEYIDVDARLKNKLTLRDRLKQLLEKATDVKDILAIETELNRVQADIDSMEGRIKSLKGQVDMATVDLTLERRDILGPLGYFFKGLWWGVEKMFVIRK